ncbi:methyltransferase family protein [Desulfoluna spongiiphila]|uniref:Protein-S-isoprenylcysteine O-methyltransferase Ste14 n=1 Tax=Desulfoluna spongiiphila TaxID=419481 RepID=A0A1G5GC53_9BACT|nr:isoprenylcysteine carboxylmethyltransferase family protein [Desulfoluna spongiiphila]SCY49133.1 Protein-S-isoprenylcysteine O-methyltransferase Ste14 [Desulfoluna spongiiphila]VVS93645.1 phospholipid methyltransferase [Desulfoluna spongiiphila]
MAHLELKIPPVLVTALFGFFMWATTLVVPGSGLPLWLRGTAFGLGCGAGAFFIATGVLSFRRAGTTVNPLAPGATTFVTTGIYRRSRNPMYVGLLLLLVGWGLLLANVGALLWTALFVPYISRFQIQPEERALEKRFGEAFTSYKKKVPRWL